VRKYKQVAIVVKDAQKTMKHYWEILGIGPWDVRHFTPKTVRDFHYNGERVTEDFEFMCCVCWEGDVELEIIQPVKGPNVYWKFLEEKGEGLHHIKEIWSDEEIPQVLQDLKAKGFDVMQTGWIDNDVHYYLNTENELGFNLEIGNGGKIGAPDYRYPPDK
jgi:hypothetical protein